MFEKLPYDELVRRIAALAAKYPHLIKYNQDVGPMHGNRLIVIFLASNVRAVYTENAWSNAGIAANKEFFQIINHELGLIGGIPLAVKPKKEVTDWDRRMLKLASGEINSWSKDPSTKVSATIFRGKHPVAMSYNGFPPGIADTPERLNDRELKYKLVQHAEANAIATCAKLGISTEGTTMAVTHHPCPTCAGQMIAAGITKVICQTPSPDFLSRWEDQLNLAKQLFKEAEVELVIIDLEA